MTAFEIEKPAQSLTTLRDPTHNVRACALNLRTFRDLGVFYVSLGGGLSFFLFFLAFFLIARVFVGMETNW